jgi:hypothetical protein
VASLALGLLAFALRLAVGFWLRPITQQLDTWLGLVLLIGAPIAAAAVPLGIFSLLIAGHWRRPARFDLKDGQFVAPHYAAAAGFVVIGLFVVGASVVPIQRQGDAMGVTHLVGVRVIAFAIVGLLTAAAIAFAVIERPRVHLDPRGLTIRHLRTVTHVAWDQLLHGGPPAPSRRARHLMVYLKAPVGWPVGVGIPIAWLEVEPAFLAAAIRHYAEHPENRAAIGSGEELARLQAAFEVDRGENAGTGDASAPRSLAR